MQCQTVMSNKAVKERRFRQREKQRKRFESPMRKFIEVKYPNIFQEYTELYNTLNRNHPDVRNLVKTRTFRSWLNTVKDEASALDILSAAIRQTLEQNETPRVRDEAANHESGGETDDEAERVDEAANHESGGEADDEAERVDEAANHESGDEAERVDEAANHESGDEANEAANALSGVDNIVDVLMNVEDRVDDIIHELMQDQAIRDIIVEPGDEGIEINPLDDIVYDIEPFDFNAEVENYNW